jgi:hypothetical protein
MAITTTTEAYEAYDEALDANGTVTIAGYEYEVSRALREVDPVAYRCGFNDWANDEGIDTDELEGAFYRHH